MENNTVDWTIGDHLENFNNPHEVTKAQVGLGNVENVRQYSELNPPPRYINTVCGKKPDANGDIDLVKGDVNLGKVDNVKQYSEKNPPPYPVTSVNGMTGAVNIVLPDISGLQTAINTHTANVCNPHQVTKDQVGLGNVPNVLPYHSGNKPGKADVGLGNVDNTTDLDKPVSTAVQAALDAKLNLTGGIISGDLKIKNKDVATIQRGMADVRLNGGANIGYSFRSSRYSVIGNICIVEFNFVMNGKTPSEPIVLQLANLPFEPVGYIAGMSSVCLSNLAGDVPSPQCGAVRQYDKVFRFQYNGGVSKYFQDLTSNRIQNETTIAGSIQYFI